MKTLNTSRKFISRMSIVKFGIEKLLLVNSDSKLKFVVRSKLGFEVYTMQFLLFPVNLHTNDYLSSVIDYLFFQISFFRNQRYAQN